MTIEEIVKLTEDGYPEESASGRRSLAQELEKLEREKLSK